MRTTVTLDDELLAKAGASMGTTVRSVLLHEGLKLIVQREAARRLAALGASAPELDLPARRRPAPEAARAARPRRTR